MKDRYHNNTMLIQLILLAALISPPDININVTPNVVYIKAERSKVYVGPIANKENTGVRINDLQAQNGRQ